MSLAALLNKLYFVGEWMSSRLLVVSLEVMIFALIIWLLLRVARFRSARIRGIIWLVVMLKISFSLFIVLPISLPSLSSPSIHKQEIAKDYPAELSAIEGINNARGMQKENPQISASAKYNTRESSSTIDRLNTWQQIGWQHVIAVLWLTGCSVMFIRLATGLKSIRKIYQSTETAPSHILSILLSCQKQLGIRTNVEVRLLNNISVPILSGFLKPVIILPNYFIDKFSPSELHLMLMHELAHWKYRDTWVLLIKRLIKAFFFFHPVVWYAGRQVAKESEASCDELVIAVSGNPKAYIRCLMKAIQQASIPDSLTIPQFSVGGTAVYDRIRKLLEEDIGMFSTKIRPQVIVALIIIALLGLPSCSSKKVIDNSKAITIEERLMPEAKVFAKIVLPKGVDINVAAILGDEDIIAQKMDDYMVWRKPISAFGSKSTIPEFSTEPYPDGINLAFALSETGLLYIGAEGELSDILSVVGTLYWGAGLNYGVWDSFGCPTFWRIGKREPHTPFYTPYIADTMSEPDDGTYEPEDIGLVGMAWREMMSLQEKEHISGIPPYDSTFRNYSLISIKHNLEKPIWIVFCPVFIAGRDEWTDWGVGLPMNDLWCQFASIFDNGEARRTFNIEYTNEIASYIYCGLHTNNGEKSWVKLDDEELLRQSNWSFRSKKLYNHYPAKVEVGGFKAWSTINPAMTLTVVADSVNIPVWNEYPSLGMRRNPKPDVVMLKPNEWSEPKPIPMEFMSLEPVPSVSESGESVPSLLDLLRNEVILPKQQDERLIYNGDFELGLEGWKKGLGTDLRKSTRTSNIRYDNDIESNVVVIKRVGGGASGSATGLYQDIFIDLDKYEDARLKVDVKPVFQSLTGGGWAGGEEYPVTLQIAYIDQRGEPHLWSRGFYYKDVSRYEDGIKVDEEAWFSFVSPNLKKIEPDCADNLRSADKIAWGKYVPTYKPPVIPKYITRLLVTGVGWDYEGRADNVELILAPYSGGNPDE